MTFNVKVQDGNGIYIVYTVEANSQAELDAYLAQSITAETLASNYSSQAGSTSQRTFFYFAG